MSSVVSHPAQGIYNPNTPGHIQLLTSVEHQQREKYSLVSIASNSVALPEVLFVRGSYIERCQKSDGIQQHDTPIACSIELAFKCKRRKWHVKVTFNGTLQSSEIDLKRSQRRKDFEDLCRCIDFSNISLLDDTVTELLLSNEPYDAESRPLPRNEQFDMKIAYTRVLGSLRFRIQEDPSRIQFPRYDHDSMIPTIDWGIIRKEQELASGIHIIYINEKQQQYVYKEVDRPLYEPRDTEVLQQEFRNLVLLRNTKGIVQILAVVISTNPYQTDESKSLPVLRGFILEYHPHGTLRDLLCSNPKMSYPWRRWAVQIANALDSLHCRKLAHLDLKPTNVVVSAEWEMVLIDISGLAISHEWLSPEMRDVFAPWEQDVESRIQNDIWAFGKILSKMADVSCNDQETRVLKHVAFLATAEIPLRISLRDAISMLQY